MIAHVTMAAAVGKKLSLGEAWAATAGKRWRLIGLVALLGLAACPHHRRLRAAVGGGGLGRSTAAWSWSSGCCRSPRFFAFLLWFWIRLYYLPVPALMLENVGIFGAIERGHALTKRAFWRIFGIALLTTIITSIAGSMLGAPITFVLQALADGGLSSQYAALSFSLVNAISSVVQAAFVAPFTAAVTSLQYVDQRIRKEAFDVELMTRAGITAS